MRAAQCYVPQRSLDAAAKMPQFSPAHPRLIRLGSFQLTRSHYPVGLARPSCSVPLSTLVARASGSSSRSGMKVNTLGQTSSIAASLSLWVLESSLKPTISGTIRCFSGRLRGRVGARRWLGLADWLCDPLRSRNGRIGLHSRLPADERLLWGLAHCALSSDKSFRQMIDVVGRAPQMPQGF